MHFAQTLPIDMPTPVLLTDVVRMPEYDVPSTPRPLSTLSPSTLSPSMLSDLRRFADEVCETDLLPVLAAIVRHTKPLVMHLQHEDRVLALSVFPREQQFHCSLDLCALPAQAIERLRLTHVSPFLGPGPHDPAGAAAPHVGVLAPLLWQLALHGARDELLPEIAGPVRYRLAPGVPLRSLPMDAWSLPMLKRLRREATTLRELATRTTQAQVQRLLNAVYLQGRLMITRSLPMQRRRSVVRWSAR
jgi:hypothetical protein